MGSLIKNEETEGILDEGSPNHWSSSLMCSLCLDYFDKPRVLQQCGHTFCQDCIGPVVQSAIRRNTAASRRYGRGHANQETFECPMCRTQYSPIAYTRYASRNLIVEDALERWLVSRDREMVQLIRERKTEREDMKSFGLAFECDSDVEVEFADAAALAKQDRCEMGTQSEESTASSETQTTRADSRSSSTQSMSTQMDSSMQTITPEGLDMSIQTISTQVVSSTQTLTPAILHASIQTDCYQVDASTQMTPPEKCDTSTQTGRRYTDSSTQMEEPERSDLWEFLCPCLPHFWACTCLVTAVGACLFDAVPSFYGVSGADESSYKVSTLAALATTATGLVTSAVSSVFSVQEFLPVAQRFLSEQIGKWWK